MAKKYSGSLLHDWARRGATARLVELELERSAILSAFPDLARGTRGSRPAFGVSAAAPVDALGRRRRRISSQGRKRMSEGMRKYWAKKKAAEKKEAK